MAFSYCFIFKMFTWDVFLLSLAAYTFIRVAFFDIAYNLTSGNKWSYMGGENWWDKWLVKVPPFGMVFIRVILLAVGIAIVIKEL
jgi:hypothetical protein